MILYILRHGIADPKSLGLPDAKRALTSEGRAKVRSVLKRARQAGVAPAVILTSPLVRAVQTAELTADELKGTNEIVQTKALSPRATPEHTWEEIRKYADQGEVMVTGHEPHLHRLVAYVLGTPTLKLDLKKGGLVRVRFDKVTALPHGILEWILVPDAFSMSAKRWQAAHPVRERLAPFAERVRSASLRMKMFGP